MNAQIILDIRKGEASDFVKTAPSTYDLNKNKKEKKLSKAVEETEKERGRKNNCSGQFHGQGWGKPCLFDASFQGLQRQHNER